jgi:poly-gamma-glutamate synthesis protein (capsule biosynthesis protein)
MVVHAGHADDVVGIFGRLYDARWPIRRMHLVSGYGGNDNRSMAANNTSAYNCRQVAGEDTWSRHAYGAAIDINPVQNPYVTGEGARPPRGRRFADVGRSVGAEAGQGVIKRGDVVVRAFGEKGWTWGGTWSQPDYQHFAVR